MTTLCCRVSLIASLLVMAVALGCSSSSDASAPASYDCLGPSCQRSGSGGTRPVASVVVGEDAGSEGSVPKWDPLCGAGCKPDQETPCDPDGTAGSAGAGGDLDAGGQSGEAGALGGGTVYSCHVQFQEESGSPVVARCEPTGSATAGPAWPSPCASAGDCAPGYACVGEQNGQCLKYCCLGSTACDKGTFCTTRPLFDRDRVPTEKSQLVPVCQTADNCRLTEPLDCPTTNQTCVCKSGTACTLVAEATTSCMTPGTGTTGQPCPCAPLYVCSQGTQTCQALCSNTPGIHGCDGGICQSSSWLPSDDLGICTIGTGLDGG